MDCNKENHDKTRFYGKDKKGSYDRIVKNIGLLTSLENVDITLRVNYTKDTLGCCTDIIDSFSENQREKIRVIFAHIWQDRNINDYKERIELSNTEANLNDIFRKSGFNVHNTYFSCHSNYSCYADLKNEAVINYDGRVFKCTTGDFEKYPEDGILTPEGEIVWDDSALAKRIGRATFDNKVCIKCKYLPICKGGCSTHPVFERLVNNKCTFKPRLKHSIEKIMREFDALDYKMCHISYIQNILFKKL